ncbi:MAG: biosynthetic-type acetolactate synthase large subunit [Bacteroidota bacterium]
MEVVSKNKSNKAIKPTAIKMSGADAVIRSLIDHGVDYIFGYPGGANMPIYDSVYNMSDEITHVLARHEQGAIHAAEGYARSSGRVGVVFATSGPGATNLITGIADAHLDSTPLVCITGQVNANLLGSDAFQETDVTGITSPITKWNYQLTKKEEIVEVIAKAFYIASTGRPGPVLIDISKDIQFEEIEYELKKHEYIRSYVPYPKLNIEELKEAAELINSAKKPMIIFGQGVILSGAEKQLKELVEKADIPAANTLLGISALDTDHPNAVGMVGMHGNYAPNVLTNSCDVLIAIGMRFDDRITGDLNQYAKQAKVIHFDIDKSEFHKNVKAEVTVLGDAKATLTNVLDYIEKNNHSDWKAEFDKLEAIEKEEIWDKILKPSEGKITMAEVVRDVSKMTDGEAVVVTDVGQHQMFASRYSLFKQTKSFISSGGLGTMGFGLPAAIGAKLGAPNREVVSFSGDGGFQMTMQEFGTIMEYGVTVKQVVLNNGYLGMVRQWQDLFFDKRYASTPMMSPEFGKIAEAYGIEYKKVEKREDLQAALQEMLDCDKSYLLEVAVQEELNVFPMVPGGAAVTEVRLK